MGLIYKININIMSSMSTKLDDLPDSEYLYENEVYTKSPQTNAPNDMENIIKSNDNDKSNIRANVKKRVRFQDDEKSNGLVEILKNEINEENVLLFVILFISSYPELTDLIGKIPFLNKWSSNTFALMSIKALLLLVAFLFVKIYILPNLKV